jgi:nucleoside-diphosphate-sugar epimerase
MRGVSTVGPVLVTGGSGFLGRALCAALLARGESVVVFDLAPPKAPIRHDAIRYETGDIRDLSALSEVAGRHGIRAIVHLAALVIPACRANPVLGAEVNIIGHINVLELARMTGISRVVYTSSLAAKPRGALASPVNLYGAYKHCCEEISKVYFLDHGIASVGLRPNVVYGPGRIEGETAAITQVIRAAATGERYEMPFSGEMCFQHVDEVTEIFLRCLAATPDGPVVSDLTTDVLSTADLLAAIRRLAPDAKVDAAPVHRAGPKGLDNTPLRDLIGDWAAVPLEDGVARTLAAFRGGGGES